MSIINIPEKTIEEITTTSYTYDAFSINSINPTQNGINVSVFLYKSNGDEITNIPMFIRAKEIFVESSIYVNFTPADLTEYITNLLL